LQHGGLIGGGQIGVGGGQISLGGGQIGVGGGQISFGGGQIGVGGGQISMGLGQGGGQAGLQQLGRSLLRENSCASADCGSDRKPQTVNVKTNAMARRKFRIMCFILEVNQSNELKVKLV